MRVNFYAGSRLDRIGGRRKDDADMAALLRDPDALLLPVLSGRHLVHDEGDALRASMPRAAASPALSARVAEDSSVLLGLLDGTPVIAVELGDEAPSGILAAGGRFEELRQVASRLDGEEASMLAHARGVLNWRRTHRFCPRCAAACRPIEGGHVLACTGCGAHQFARTDPAVIMLVRCGERVLLARAPHFPARMFSTLAGFVEPGESLEEAVAREVREECGVRVSDVGYHSSQPWPFPGSIMLGFVAETTEDRIEIDADEIADARFFTRDEVRAPEAHGFELPPATSIARRMIEDWLEA